MRILSVLAIALIAAPSFAQSISLFPGTASFTSRGNIGTGSGDILMGLHNSHWRGIGDSGTACTVSGFRSILQDQNIATQESYHWVARSGSDANGPAAGSAGLLHRFGPFNMPTGAAGGPAAWILTTTLTTPAALPCEAHVSAGVELAVQPAWSTDGMSCHAALEALADQHTNALDMSWQIINGATTHPSGKRSWSHSILLGNPTLQMSVNGKNSIGGLFPVVGGTYAGQVTGAEATATAMLFLGVDAQATGFVLVPGTARLHLGNTKIKLLTSATVNASGVADLPLAAVPSQVPAFTLWLQAAIIGTSDQLTNAQATTFDL